MGRKEVSGLCLLDLSAAFDTIDHQILLDRLSLWFGLSGTAHLWFKSYLSSRSSSVHCANHFSAPQSSPYGLPQGSVLGPILFNLYTTPLSSLIGASNLDHQMFADDTQLLISFLPNSFTAAVSDLQNDFAEVSSWMNANLLSLNPSKTEFLLIGLPKQLKKVTDPKLASPSRPTSPSPQLPPHAILGSSWTRI